MTLYRGREQMTFNADFGLEAFNIEVGDIIAFTNDRYGFDEKEFEVIGWKFASNQQAGDLRVTLTLQETSEAAFDWSAEESDIINNNTNLPSPGAGLAINNLSASGGGRTQGDGTFINSAILDWDAVTNAFNAYYEIEWKALSDSNYSSTTTVESSIEITPLVDGVEYIFRVRAITAAGFKGSYSTVQFTGGGDVTAPGLPTAITADGGFRYITVSWTNPADADLNFVEVWENTSNTSSGATKVGTSGGNEFIRSNLGIQETKYYFLKSVDYSGNASAFTSGVSATTTFIDDNDFANGVYSLFTDQGLYAIEDVSSLPASGAFTGEKVFNTSDAKLYSWTGSAWESVAADVGTLDFSDLTGTLANAQIAVNAIDGTKITDNTITSSEIAANTINAGNIAANAIGTSELNALAVNADKIAANAITATKISAGVITGDKISANTITGGLIAASGIITSSAQINDSVIINAKIQNAAIDTLKVAGDSITQSSFLTFALSSSTSKIFSGTTTMAYAGDLIAIINFGIFGSFSSSSTASATMYIDGTSMQGINYSSSAAGDHTFSGEKSVTAGIKTVQLQISGVTNIPNFQSNCYMTLLKRYR